MRNKINILLAGLLLIFTVSSCGKDNFDEPNATLTGKVTYNGETLRLRGTGEAVQLQLYQDGYAKYDPIAVYVGQDGTFSAKLFNGEYKLVTRDNNGPWVNSRDTSFISVKGHTTFDLSVTPYFMISGTNLSLSGNTVSASFTISQIVSNVGIERVYLLLSKTQFVDEVNNVYRKDFTDISAGSMSISGDFNDVSDAVNANALYGRVGVKSNQTGEAIFSDVIKLK